MGAAFGAGAGAALFDSKLDCPAWPARRPAAAAANAARCTAASRGAASRAGQGCFGRAGQAAGSRRASSQ
jgi:hypothetical protein